VQLRRTLRYSAAVDLGIVLAIFAMVSLSVPLLNPILRQGRGMPGVFAAAAYQFVMEGIGPLVLMLMRRERFSGYALIGRNLARSVALGLGLAVLYDLGLSWEAGTLLWIPLRRQPAVRMSLTAGFPLGIIGLAVTVLDWGFLEGFFGVYFARKINLIAEHSGRGWFTPGAIAFALFNGGAHLIVGQGLQGFVTSFASGYAIAVVPAVTGNAWGGVLVQVLTNAVGGL